MLTSRDFKELLSTLAGHSVRYLVVGGYALMRYTEPRYTKDLDIWISIDPQNAQAVFDALQEFGAPLTGLAPADFAAPGFYYKMGNPPYRLDVLMSVSGLEFEDAWSRRVEVDLQGVAVPFLSLPDLITNKLAAGRPQDLVDAERLKDALRLQQE
jgi:hypothetical protein